jgi:hypothetical protein
MAHVVRFTPLTLPLSLHLKATILRANSSARSTDLKAYAENIHANEAVQIG